MKRTFLFLLLLIPVLAACSPQVDTPPSEETPAAQTSDIKDLGMDEALNELDLVDE